MTQTTTFQLKKAINNFGFYCEIKITVTQNVKHLENKLVYNDKIFGDEWKIPLEFGFLYFFKHLAYLGTGFTITVNDLKTNPVDTKAIVIVYSMFKALCNNFNIQSDLMEISETGVFLIKK
ncbi:MAG: hypothetical protein R2774_01560 [Saprospiraceae bacterium]